MKSEGTIKNLSIDGVAQVIHKEGDPLLLIYKDETYKCRFCFSTEFESRPFNGVISEGVNIFCLSCGTIATRHPVRLNKKTNQGEDNAIF